MAWFLFALVLLAEYWNYERGAELTKVCAAVPWPEVTQAHPKTALEEAQAICVNRELGNDADDQAQGRVGAARHPIAFEAQPRRWEPSRSGSRGRELRPRGPP